MPFLRTNSKVSILCFNETAEKYWFSELKEAGVPVNPVKIFKPTVNYLSEQVLLLIQPDFDKLQSPSFEHVNQMLKSKDNILFIVSDDERWKAAIAGKNSFLLPKHTHPLELARLMVEKLNLPLVSNKTQYAFSIFSF
jgi:hypothetical protein